MFAPKILFNQCADKEIYDLNINNKKLPQLIPKENDITSVIKNIWFHNNLSLKKI